MAVKLLGEREREKERKRERKRERERQREVVTLDCMLRSCHVRVSE